jgi:hypothetical protein
MKKKWLSPAEKCDICGAILHDTSEYFVDGKTIYGPWALMCPICHEDVGCGLGCGLGQKYDTKTKELLEGGCPNAE